MKRYERNIPAITPEECQILSGAHVAVIGCGGLGGHLTELLARVGVGSITVCDGDIFSESNLNRQLLCVEENLGENKAREAVKRIKAVNSGVKTVCFDVYLDDKNAKDIISGCDIVFDGLDSIPARKTLAGACDEMQIPYIYGAIRGWSAQAAVCMPGSGLIDRLFPGYVRVTDKSVLSFAPAMCAAMQVSLGVKVLLGREFEASRVYYYDLLYGELESIDF